MADGVKTKGVERFVREKIKYREGSYPKPVSDDRGYLLHGMQAGVAWCGTLRMNMWNTEAVAGAAGGDGCRFTDSASRRPP